MNHDIKFDSRPGGDVHWAKAKAQVEANLHEAVVRQMEEDIARQNAMPPVYTRNPLDFARDFEKANPGKYIQNIAAVRSTFGMRLKDAKDLVDLAVGRSITTPNPDWRSEHRL